MADAIKQADGLLGALRGTDARARDGAFRTLLAEHGVSFDLDERGKVNLPAGGPVNQQPGSIIQQAATDLWEGLSAILGQCKTDDELRHLFAAIVKRRRADRFRRVGNKGMPIDTCIISPPVRRSGGHKSPETRIAEPDQFRSHVARLLAGAAGQIGQVDEPEGGDARERRRLVELYVLKQMDWPDVAQAMGGTVGALKVRFTRLRPRLIEAVYRSFLRSLSPEHAKAARTLLVEGKDLEAGAKDLAITEEDARHLLVAEIMPKMREHYGPAFLELLPRIQRQAG